MDHFTADHDGLAQHARDVLRVHGEHVTVQHNRSAPAHVKRAARVVEYVRAGLGDKDFSRLIEGLADILAELADKAQPVSAN